MIQITDLIPTPILKQILIIIIYSFSAISILMFLFLIFDKIYIERREKKKQQLKEKYRYEISLHLFGSKQFTSFPISNLQHEAFIEVIMEMISNISGEEKSKLQDVIRNSDAVEYLKRKARSLFWTIRYLATEQLSYFELDELDKYFVSVVKKDKQEEIKAIALWALSLVANKHSMMIAILELAGDMHTSIKFKEDIFTNIIISLKNKNSIIDFIQFLIDVKVINLLPKEVVIAVIMACGNTKLYDTTHIILKFFHVFNHDTQIKNACITTLSQIGGASTNEVIKLGLIDPDWKIRSVAASVAHMASRDILPLLRKGLNDENMLVKYNAARSLIKFGQIGIDILNEERIPKDPEFGIFSGGGLALEGETVA
jgi:uncharacterized protein Smg (DUF494 family)